MTDRANQRNAVLAGFLGWTLDAFDFFILTLVLDDLAHAFGRRARPQIALAITLTLAMRPVGAIIFGLMADRFGRRMPLMLNVIFYAIISVLCGLAQSYGAFIALRMLFGIGMGGEWGVGASLALESASPRIRGLLSGLLQEGYAIGNLLAALAFRTIYPWSPTRTIRATAGASCSSSAACRRCCRCSSARGSRNPRRGTSTGPTGPTTGGRSSRNWPRFLYLVLLMTMMNFMSHGTQDMYPTLLGTFGYAKRRIADITILSMIGAVLGGLVFGYYSDRSGRRRAMITAAVCGSLVLPLWIAGFSPLYDDCRRVPDAVLRAGRLGRHSGAHQRAVARRRSAGSFPGFAYQLGVMCASSIPYARVVARRDVHLSQSMGGLMTIVFIAAIVVIASGPENRGVSFRKAPL